VVVVVLALTGWGLHPAGGRRVDLPTVVGPPAGPAPSAQGAV
jgi:hypothetical protein